MPRMQLALRAVRAPQRHRPARVLFIVGAALEFNAVPVVELHRLGVGLEPVRELVLRDVDRPVRRERHVRQVVDVHLVVQRERVVAPAPVVADARPAVDDQRVDLELAEARRRREPALSAADHENRGVAIFIGGALLPEIEPVRTGEIARIRPALRAPAADVLFELLELVERREDRPRTRCVFIRKKTQDTGSAAQPRFQTCRAPRRTSFRRASRGAARCARGRS